jgi:hypothetical protein
MGIGVCRGIPACIGVVLTCIGMYQCVPACVGV